MIELLNIHTKQSNFINMWYYAFSFKNISPDSWRQQPQSGSVPNNAAHLKSLKHLHADF